MALTDQQREDRRAYIGGSDAPALAGVNPPGWAQPIDVWSEKVGLPVPRRETRMMDMGHRMEQLVAELAGEALDVRWRRPQGQYHSRQYPWAGGNVDRIGYVPDPQPGIATFDRAAILECKWTARRDGWGPSFHRALTGEPQPKLEVPIHYAVQVQHYLAVTGREVAVLAVLLGYADFRWYLIERNEPMIAGLMELEERFWREHVVPQVPPEPDGSESYGRHLRRIYAADDAHEAVATPEQALLATRLHEAIAARKAAEREEARIAQELQLSMGLTAKLVGPGFTINWRTGKPPLNVQWEELATALLLDQRTVLAASSPTKKALAAAIRTEALARGLAEEGKPSRPWKPTFDADTSDDGEES